MSHLNSSDRSVAEKSFTCYLIGQDNLLPECAKILRSKSFSILGVISHSSRVRLWAQEQGIPCFHSMSEINWQDHSADYLFSIVNNEIIPSGVLKKIRHLAINYHDAPLPRYAGSNATSWAIINSEHHHAVTWHVINEVIDGGDILKQALIPLRHDETALSLNYQCAERAVDSFSELINELVNDSHQSLPQDVQQRTYFSRAKKPVNNGWINWSNTAEQIDRLFRATQFGLYPNPFATTKIVLGDEAFVVDTLTVLSEISDIPPGSVLKIAPSYWEIATATYVVRLSGLSTMKGEPVEFNTLTRQYQIKVGTQLTSPSLEEGELFVKLSQEYFSNEAYWIEKLTGFEPTTVTSKQRDVNLQRLPEALASRFLRFADDKEEVSLAVLGAWLVYLRRLESQSTLNVFVDLSNCAVTERLRPFFTTHVPFSVTINDTDDFHQVIKQVKQEWQRIHQHGCYLKDCGKRYPELADSLVHDHAGYQVTVGAIVESEDHHQEFLPSSFLTLCEELLKHSNQPIAEVNWITQEEQEKLLVDWNATETPYPAHKTIHGLFEDQVLKTPNQIALIAEDVHLTYQELNVRANQLAHYLLKQHGTQPDQLIAVCLERSEWMLIALLGILKSGGAYVPIDPAYPVKRTNFIVNETEAKVIITTLAHEQQLRNLPDVDWQKMTLLVLDSDEFLLTLEKQSLANPTTNATSNDLAYVMYTSGTTGTPKGIQIEHRGIVNRITWMNQVYPLHFTDRVLQKTSYVFDVSVWELFWANWYGAAIVFAKPQGHKEPFYLSELIQKQQISIIHFTPSMLNGFVQAMANREMELCSLRHLFCSGEALDAPLVQQAKVLLPGVEIHNLYGPTEASIDVLFYDCGDQQAVYLGRPINNTRAYVLDNQHHLLPVGVIGELHIAGDGLARGYINQTELTAQQFIANPFQTVQDKQAGHYDRLYKTGDLACWLPSGNLDYFGRNDNQIKLRGYRIELREIDQVMRRYPEIQQSIVIISNNKLIAYYVAQQELDSTEIKKYVATYVPEYMVPNQFVFLKKLPLSLSGKIDQKKLPLSDWSYSDNVVQPANEVETQVMMAFVTTLKLKKLPISVTDDFFKLGGDSISAIRLISKLNQVFQKKTIHVKDILKLKTIRAISALLHKQKVVMTEPEARYVPFSLVDQSQYKNKLNLDEIEDIYPASYLQMGMLFESSLNDKVIYHIVSCYEVSLPFNQERFIKVWEELTRKHALLRARFLFSEQHALDVVIFKSIYLHYQFYANRPLKELIDTERLNRFSHTEKCLFRIIVNQHLGKYEFIFSYHHVIVDGWSVANLINEFVQAYAYQGALPNRVAQQEAVPLLSYGEFVRNERQHLDDELSISFWKTYLADSEPAQPKWKFDDIATSPNGVFTHGFLLTDDEARQVHQLAQKQSISVDCIFLYVYLKTLSFFLNSNDITIGVAFSNRMEKHGGDTLFGLFTNVLPFRLQLNSEDSVRQALSATFSAKINLYAHKHIPYAHLKSIFNQNLYEIAYSFIHFPILKQCEEVIGQQRSFYRISIPLVLEVTQQDSFNVEIKANDDYVSQEYLGYFADYLKATLQNILRNQNEIGVNASDYQKLVIAWNALKKPFPKEKTVHQLFEEQVERTPDAIALVFENKQFTYQELNQRANQLAHYLLQQCQIRPDDLIILCLDTNELIVITILAVMKSGAAYVPISAAYPKERICHILRDTNALLVLTNFSHEELIKRCALNISCITLPVDHAGVAAQLQHQVISNPITAVHSRHLAYVIYTSGTTGKPNGVMIEHKGVVNLIVEIAARQGLFPNKRVAFYSNYVFDASVHELFPALLSGCSVFILPDSIRYDLHNLSSYFKQRQIQISFVPTILVSEFIKTYESDYLELIYTAGDRLVLDKEINIAHLGYQLVNEYGPTEATVGTTYQIVTASKNGTINTNNIGQPLPNYTCYVCSKNGQLVPIGVVGELWIGGVGLARGYINNSALTAKKFIPNPFQTEEEKKQAVNSTLYKTGDLVRWLPDGNLEFIARNDTQIKLRGHRIELGEIENVLGTFPGVTQNKVLPVSIQSSSSEIKRNTYLVAYYVKDAITKQEDQTEFLNYWENLYDYTYALLDQKQYRENFHGWYSSYTNEPIPKVEMLEWRDETLAKVKQLSPRKILEIGSGSGLLLFNLLEQCQHYYATDISENVIRYTDEIANRIGMKSKVTTLHVAADSIPYAKINNNYDTVILNSVVQYFPHLEYLEKVLLQLIDHMQDGQIFIGDVRDLRLLNSFYYSVLHYKNSTCGINDVSYFAEHEKELLVSPHYFIDFKNRQHRVSSIQIVPKLSKAANEMSCYRYDVILHINGIATTTKKVEANQFMPVLDLISFIKAQDQDTLYIKYPNQKIAQDYFNYQLLCHQSCDLSRDAVSDLLTLEQIQGIFYERNYDVAFHLNVFDPLYLNLIAYRKGMAPEIEIQYPANSINSTNFANNPLYKLESIEADFNYQLQLHLRDYLPNYMIPSYFFALEKFPLTINGKLDHGALPIPVQPLQGKYFSPKNQAEVKLCRIFAEILNIPEEKVSIKDDFFKIGGNSLLIFKLIAKININFGVEIQPCHIFANKTVENLSEFLAELPSMENT